MRESSQTLSRGLKLLALIADNREGVALRELASAMSLPKSIVQRLLYSLEDEGYLKRHPSQVGHQLTMKLWSLGCAAVRRLDVQNVARPALEELALKSGETAKISVLDGDEVVFIDSINGSQIVRAFLPLGGRAPAHSVATGKAILAMLPEDRGLKTVAITREPAQKRALLAREFEQIRKRGYAINRGEWEDDVAALAAPIFDAQQGVVASVGIILPHNRLTGAKTALFGRLVARAAEEISARLGYITQGTPKLKRVS
jgi:DNA-binding IclR family transcriptional regulator